MDFNAQYNRLTYIDFMTKQLLPEDFEHHEERIQPGFDTKYIKQVSQIGKCGSIELTVYEIEHESEGDPRVSLSRETFRILSEYGQSRALVLFISKNSSNYRLSLVTMDLEWSEGKRVKKVYSNPRRYSFFLGPDAKIHTVQQYLEKPGRVEDFNDLVQRFSIEVVNKEFYTQIAMKFTDLVGGSRKIGSKKYEKKGCLVLPGEDEQKRKEFAVRLIGRLVFCWFLKKKHSGKNVPLIPKAILSLQKAKELESFYHFVLEPLFFQTLNKEQQDRHKKYRGNGWNTIPFLNGGLFTPHADDHYTPDDYQGISPGGDVKVPDSWLIGLLDIFETYNFTIDESTSIDVELSIDPEMLGRIFENLLAEINPETGETARKATGSYYTPRAIVDYMVDQSVKQYLLTKAKIPEGKVDSLLDYSEEAVDAQLTDKQKELITNVLHEIKILDPACGSGAFPMGILQKILLILQKVDPDSRAWKRLILSGIKDLTARKILSHKLESETWQYIHKLGLIQNSIYGVDIQPIAAEISRLRIFLSLIVDEAVDDSEDNRGVEPLPNLKYKIVCGNSLLDKYMGRIIKIDETVQTRSKVIIDRLMSLKADYFSARSEEDKVEYNLRILQSKLELAEQLLTDLKDRNQVTDNLFGSEAQTKKQKKEKEKSVARKLQAERLNKAIENARIDMDNLTAKSEIELADVEQLEAKHFNESFIWKLDFAEIFAESNGFDIVIGNPPYVGEKGHKEMFREIKKGSLGKFYQGKMDLFYFFFHLALNLGKQHSSISFISTNYYITAFGAKRFRQDLFQRTIIRELINFNELRIFESALGQHNMITVLEKAQNKDTIARTCTTQRRGIANSEVLQQILNAKDSDACYCEVSQRNLYDGDEYYIRLGGKESDENKGPLQRILTNIESQGQSLGAICNVNNGVFAGADRLSKDKKDKYRITGARVGEGIFVLTNDEVKNLRLSKEEMKIVRPLFKNSDIKRYYTNTRGELNLINLRYTDRPNLNDYPNIKKHLTRFKELLANRPRTGTLESAFSKGFWYVMSTSRRLNFDAAKIVFPQRSNTNTFGYNDVSWYAMSDVFFITSRDECKELDLKYILALLNSKLYFLWLYHRGKRKGEVLELTGTPVAEIPIKEVTATEQNVFIEIVDRILPLTQSEDYLEQPRKQAKVKELEKQIDRMVYELYGLNTEEIAIVEGDA